MGFTQGVSGLNAAAAGLDTIGNNIANSQTVGFKSGRTEFADLYAGAKAGLGVSVTGTTQDFSDGSLETTGRDLDLAINGGGFFRLANNNQIEYSRDGQFTQTKDGKLANSSGALLTGYNASNFNDPNNASRISTSGTPQVIQLPAEGLNARATTHASLSAALDAGSSIKDGTAVNTGDPSTYNWSTPSTVYDSLGNAHSVNMYFTKTGVNQWQINSEMALGSEANVPRAVGDPPGSLDLANFTNTAGHTPSVDGNGTYTYGNYTAKVTGATLSGGAYTGGSVSYTEAPPTVELDFSTSGNLISATGGSPGVPAPANTAVGYALNAQNGSAPIDFSFDFAGSSQTAQTFAAGNPAQDGYASGALSGISIQGDGMVTGSYANGQTVNLAQIALASFRNDQGLEPTSGNAWLETAESGQPAVGTAGTGQLGSLLGRSLEKSNVDLSKELVKMIVQQRNYQANAQTIKTQDQVLQTAVNIG